MPDGTIIRNVPEGTTKAELGAKYARMKSRQAYDAARADTTPEYNPTDGMSGFDRFMAGAGKAVVDIGTGLKQIGAEAGNLVGAVSDETVTGLRQAQDERRAMDAPLMDTGAGLAGNIAGNVATIYAGGSAIKGLGALGNATRIGRAAEAAGSALRSPQTFRGAIGAGAAIGAAQPVGEFDGRLDTAAMGAIAGAAGQGIAKGLGKIAQPIKKALTPQDRRFVGILQNEGVGLDAAQRSGSKALDVAKRALSDNAVTGPQMADAAESQLRQFTRAVSRRIGEDADNLDTAVLDRAATRIGGEFDRIAANNTIKLDGQLRADLGRIRADAMRTLGKNERSVIESNLKEIFDKGRQFGEIDGKAYQNIASLLGRLSRSGQGEIKMLAREMRDSLDDALTRQVGVQERAALNEARRQYRALLQIEEAVANDSSGMVRPARLAQVLGRKANKNQWKRGRGDQSLANLARAGSRLLVDRFPNSGTTARMTGQLALGGASALGYGATTGDWSNAAKAGAAGFALPMAARYAYGAAPNYLVNGLGQGNTRNALLALERNGLLRTLPAVSSVVQQ